jgi:predicted O-methyltransferase YrrM
MRRLEKIDARDRVDGTPRMERLRQIAPETGRFVAVCAASAPDGLLFEIGTSAGYSTLYLALAARLKNTKVVTFKVLERKIGMAEETFQKADVRDVVELVGQDARRVLAEYENIAFCFLDAEKEYYSECYDLIIPQMVSGGILVADNVISHKEELAPFVDYVARDNRVDSVVVPIGRGELLVRKL